MNNGFVKYGEVSLGQDVWIGEYCVIGCPKEENIRFHFESKRGLNSIVAPVRISDRCIIGNHVCIYEGVEISSKTYIEDHVRIGYNCKIGRNVRIMYGSYICDRVAIQDNARVAGFICDGAQIGERSTVMGDLVHEYSRPHLDWWEADESPPIVESDVIIGLHALVIGSVRISSYVYVASGAIVTKSVPSRHIVLGTNDQIALMNWRGSKLGDLIGHWNRQWTSTDPSEGTS